MSELVVFDVDGTLCDTYGVDDEFYCATASTLLGVPVGVGSWKGTTHVTDSGIATWLWFHHLRRAPRTDELETFAATFEAALQGELRDAPHRFVPVAGAPAFLSLLRRRGWHVAIATGGWGRTARLKLGAAGLPIELLLASSDDSYDRNEIFRLAVQRAEETLGARPTRIVLVGDGTWDVHVAAHLSWGFVGIGRGARANQLRAVGAEHVIESFANLEQALSVVNGARIPLLKDPARDAG